MTVSFSLLICATIAYAQVRSVKLDTSTTIDLAIDELFDVVLGDPGSDGGYQWIIDATTLVQQIGKLDGDILSHPTGLVGAGYDNITFHFKVREKFGTCWHGYERF
jgi:hypothetical protein